MASREECLKALDEAVSKLNQLSEEIRGRVYSIALFGSLVRGDFEECFSDVDLFCVLNWPSLASGGWSEFAEAARPIEMVFQEAFGQLPQPRERGGLLDFVLVPKGDLPLEGTDVELSPEVDYFVFKYLGVYSFELPLWRIVYGEDFRPKLRKVDWRSLIPVMADFMAKRILRVEEPRMLVGIAVHSIRLAQVWFGEPTLDKRVALRNFHRLVPEFPLKGLADRIWGMGRRAALVTKEECESIPIREFVLQVTDLIRREDSSRR